LLGGRGRNLFKKPLDEGRLGKDFVPVTPLEGIRKAAKRAGRRGRGSSSSLTSREGKAAGVELQETELLSSASFREAVEGVAPGGRRSQWGLIGGPLSRDTNGEGEKVLSTQRV